MEKAISRLQALESFLFPPKSSDEPSWLLSLINESVNETFTLCPSEPQRKVALNEDAGLWARLPRDWKDCFVVLERGAVEGIDKLDEVLMSLAKAEEKDIFPSSLNSFLRHCRELPLNRTCSDTPLFRQTVSTLQRATQDATTNNPVAADANDVRSVGDRLPHGMSPKKAHEVSRFTSFVSRLLYPSTESLSLSLSAPPDRRRRRSKRVIDLGSGQGHLSRTLTGPPWNLDVLAVDWDERQSSGGERLHTAATKLAPKVNLSRCEARDEGGGTEKSGLLECRTQSLDEDSICDLLSANCSLDSPPLLVALHACGDLTPSALRAFLAHERRAFAPQGKASSTCLVVVGCCYNLLTHTGMRPFSSRISADMTNRLSSDARQVAAQSPVSWTLGKEQWSKASQAKKKLAFRVRWEAEWRAFSNDLQNTSTRDGQRRLGRLPDRVYKTYKAYRSAAFAKLDVSDPPPPLSLVPLSEVDVAHEDEERTWRRFVFRLSIAWTLRALLGPLVESLIVLDRYVGLCEGLQRIVKEQKDGQDGWTVELINLFDQMTGSLRNLALVVTPLDCNPTF